MKKKLLGLLILGMWQVLLAQSGTLIVLNKTDNTASLIDLATKKIVATIPTGFGPHEVSVSPDGKRAAVSNYGTPENPGNALTLIDVSGTKRLNDIGLGQYRRPHGIQWLNDGERIAVTTEANKALLIIDAESGKVERAVETDQNTSHMVVLTPDNARAFVANIGSGSVVAIDLKEAKRIATIATGEGAEGITVSPDGREVWVTNRGANTVSVIDAQSLKVAASLPSKEFPIRTKFTPDGKYTLVSNAKSGDIAVFDAGGKKELRRIAMELNALNDVDKRLFGDQFGKSPVPIGILVLPTGTHAYIANSNADMVTVIDLKEWKIVDRIPTGKEPDGLGYSSLVLTK